MNIPVYPADDWGFVFTVVLVGLVTVFAILLVLIAILTLSGKLLIAGEKKTAQKSKSSPRVVVIAEEIQKDAGKKPARFTKQENEKPTSDNVQAIEKQDNNEVIAAITAAITGFSKKKIRVVSAKPLQNNSPIPKRGFTNWGMAGKIYNTRDFTQTNHSKF